MPVPINAPNAILNDFAGAPFSSLKFLAYSPSNSSYTKHGHRLRILKIRDNTIKIEKLVKRLRND
jgi:hypothetical protein